MIRRIKNEGRNSGSVWQAVESATCDRKYASEFYLKGMPENVHLYCLENENHKVVVKDNEVKATIKPSGLMFADHKVDIEFTNKQPQRKTYTSLGFGKLVILYKGKIGEIFLNGKKVGVFNTVGYFLNNFWYKRRCKKKGVDPEKRLQSCDYQFDDSLIAPELMVFVIRIIYGIEREMS